MLPALRCADAAVQMSMSRLEEIAQRMGRIPQHVLAGFSGGCDSTALVLLLIKKEIQLTCVHVNHGIRGAEADEDEAFVRDFCRKHGVPLLVYHAHPPEHPSEGWAREARYAYFREAMEKSGAQALVLAHHSDDQAETMLQHLLRGSGLHGLCAMKPVSEAQGMKILRPLLGVTHQELQEALEETGQSWCEDSSNSGNDYLRNRIRHQLIPLMEQIAPGASRRIAAASLMLQEDADVLDELVHRADAWMGKPEIPLEVLDCPSAVQSRILRAWWSSLTGPRMERALSYEKTTQLQSLVRETNGASCNLPGNVKAVRGYRYLHMISPKQERETDQWKLQDGLSVLGLTLEIREAEECTGNGRNAQVVPAAWLEDLTVRTRRTGDWIAPFGQCGKQMLKEYLIDRKIDQPFRDRIPLICRGSEIIICCGVGAGGIPRKNGQSDEPYVLISWHGDMPWTSNEKEK